MTLRLPDISGLNDSERISQLQDYLYTLVRELNYSLSDIEKGNASVVTSSSKTSRAPAATEQKAEQETTDKLFNALKPLIIKNAEIISSYSDEIAKRFEGEYVTSSVFGSYVEKTDATISQNDARLTQQYNNLQKCFAPGEDKAIVKTTSATITTGLLNYDADGNAIYGMEVSTLTDNTTRASARFLATGVVVYDEAGNEALIITDNAINAKNINITVSCNMGGMLTTVSGTTITGKYVG